MHVINVSKRVLELASAGMDALGIVKQLAAEGCRLPLENVQRLLARPAPAAPTTRRPTRWPSLVHRSG